MRAISIGILLFSCWHCMQAQTGLVVSSERYSQLPLLPTYSGQKFNDIPLKVSLKRYCPVPGDQGKISACVGWAVGYGAHTIIYAQRTKITDPALITQAAFSSAFVYNQIKLHPDDCNSGAYIEDALALLRDRGNCKEEQFNYRQADCKAIPFGSIMEEAAQYRIMDYAAVFELDEPGKSKVAKACKILATQMPLVVGMAITPGFANIKPGTSLWTLEEQEPISGYHAMVLIGYDNVERRFELMNSFGPGWGQGGFIKIRYEDFERLCRYAYVLLPDETALLQMGSTPGTSASTAPPVAAPLSGEFVFRTPGGYLVNAAGDEIPFFEEVATYRNEASGIYETQQPVFPVGGVFQIVAREIPRGRYVYVFSRSPNGKVQYHFPKFTSLGGRTASFVLEKTAEIVIPGEETVLQLPAPGDDWLCLLFCERAISDIESRLRRIDEHTADFPQAIAEVFADLLIPAQQVRFQKEQMGFSAIASRNQIAVPLILRVRAQ